MRVRITFTKQGPLRYIGNLDLHRLWERAMRRAELPISYSQGFNPQPKISLAAALPLGFSSRAEVLDVRLNEDLETDDIYNRLKVSLPPDIQVTQVESVDERLPALQTQTLSAAYSVQLTEPVDGSDLKRRVEELMNAESIPRERRGKTYDLRPLVELMSVITQADGSVWLEMTVAARESATGRPEEVLLVLGIEPETARVERIRLVLKE